jgi:hypothetical protein
MRELITQLILSVLLLITGFFVALIRCVESRKRLYGADRVALF